MRNPEKISQGHIWVPAGPDQWRRARNAALRNSASTVLIISNKGKILYEWCDLGYGDIKWILSGGYFCPLDLDGRKPDNAWLDKQGFLISIQTAYKRQMRRQQRKIKRVTRDT